jgi:hypothetical protein
MTHRIALLVTGASGMLLPRHVLGRLAAKVEHLPHAGESCVVMAWPLGDEGRKLYAGTALFGEDGRVLGSARATWIALR